MQRRDGKRFPHSQFIEDGDHLPLFDAVCLVHHQVDWGVRLASHFLLMAAQHVRHFLVGRCHAISGIHHEQYSVCFLDCQHCLLADLLHIICGADRKRRISPAGGINASGIDDVEFNAVPNAGCKQPVTRGARYIIHDRQLLARQPVEQ